MNVRYLRPLIAVVGLALALTVLLAACGGDDPTPTPRPTATPTSPAMMEPTPTEPPAVEKPKLIFSDLNWDSAQIQNAVARFILENGYGYETDAVFGGTIPLMEALTRGDTNISMEIWLPNQQEAYDAAIAQGTITSIGNSLEDNWQSAFIIPQYTADANPGLRSVDDLPEYMELFVTTDSRGKARLITCIPGWECEGVNEKKLVAYGLEDTVELVNPGSAEALNAEILSAFENEEDVLFYYWGPTTLSHKLNTEFDGYVVLEEPPYTAECWAADSGCSYPTAEVLVTVRSELLDSAPDAVDFLKKWDWSASNQLAAEGYFVDMGAEYGDVATWWLANNDAWKSWVTSEATAKIEAAL